MSESKYEKYFIRDVVRENRFGGESISLNTVPPDIIPPSARLTLGVTAVTKPYVFHETVHKHMFTEYFVFFGSNPHDMQEFDADVEFTFGAEKEKSVIKTPTIVLAPPGVYHCPLNYARVGQPLYCVEAFLTSAYSGVDLGEDLNEIRLEEASYKRFYTSGVVRGNQFGGEVIGMHHIPEHLVPAAAHLNMAVSAIKKPYMFFDKTHKHNFTEFFFFMGSNPHNLREFEAELAIYMGPEKEKHLINSPTIVVVPPGVYHCPMEFIKVDKPIFSIETFITSRYSMTELPVPAV